MHALERQSLGLPALPKLDPILQNKNYKQPVCGYNWKEGWNELVGIHWTLKGQFCPKCGSENVKINWDENESYSGKLRREKSSKMFLLKDIFLYFFDNQMSPTTFDNQENVTL